MIAVREILRTYGQGAPTKVLTDESFMQQLALRHGEPVAVTSLAGSLMFANPAFAALCDSCAPGALVGINVVAASRGRIGAAALDSALKSEVRQHLRWSDERRASRDFVCAIRCVREDNVPLCLVLTLHDADSLIAAHRHERDELDALCEASGLIDAFSWQLRLDEPAARIRWSPHAATVLGVGAGSLPTDLPAFLRWILPEDRNSVQRAISGAIEQSGGYQIEYRLRSPEGSLHPMIGLGRVDTGIDGSRHLIALELDATRRSFAGDGSVFHERLLSAVLAGTDQPICILDRQLRYSYFNAAYASLIAATQGVTVSSGALVLESIQDPVRRRRLGATLSRSLKGERLIETMEFEYPESRARQWVDFSFSPLLTTDGRVEGIVACGQDVSAARHAEHRRRRFHEELQRRVKQQTESLDTANRELNAVLTSAARAFDDPLHRLEAALNTLQQPTDAATSPDVEAALRQARLAADEISALVRELPAMPAVAACELKLEQVDMNRLVRDCTQNATSQTINHQVEFDVGALPPLRADRTLLRTVMRNLLVTVTRLTNAQQPTKVTVHAAQQGDEVVWTVANGSGLTGERTDSYEPTEAGPSGVLSLAVVRAAVQRLGGRLWVETAPDRSVAFNFVIAAE